MLNPRMQGRTHTHTHSDDTLVSPQPKLAHWDSAGSRVVSLPVLVRSSGILAVTSPLILETITEHSCRGHCVTSVSVASPHTVTVIWGHYRRIRPQLHQNEDKFMLLVLYCEWPKKKNNIYNSQLTFLPGFYLQKEIFSLKTYLVNKIIHTFHNGLEPGGATGNLCAGLSVSVSLVLTLQSHTHTHKHRNVKQRRRADLPG